MYACAGGGDQGGNELYHDGALSGHRCVPDVDAEDFTDFGLDERVHVGSTEFVSK